MLTPDFSTPAATPKDDPTLERPPLKPGTVYLADEVKQELRLIGWQDGDPVPANLAAKIAQLAAEATGPAPAPVLPAGHVPPRPKIVKISDLPPEKQAELAKDLEKAKAMLARSGEAAAAVQAAMARTPQGVPQSVAAAIDQMSRATQARSEPASVAFVDDTQQKPAPAAAAPPPTTTQATKPDEPETLAPVHICPRCLWDTRMVYEAKPTDADRLAYFVAFRGGTRFEKEYALLNGAVLVTFRDLLTHETDAIWSQMAEDTKTANALAFDAFYHMRLLSYRLSLGLAKLVIDGVPTFVNSKSLKDVPAQPNVNVLTRLREMIESDVLTKETVRKVISGVFAEFQRLVEALEVEVLREDFSKGIGQRI